MKRKTPFVAAALAAGLSFYSSCTPTEKAETKDYTQYVNTFIVLQIMVIHSLGRVILSV